MAHEETVMEFMNQLVIACKHVIGDLMAHKEICIAVTATVNHKEVCSQSKGVIRGSS